MLTQLRIRLLTRSAIRSVARSWILLLIQKKTCPTSLWAVSNYVFLSLSHFIYILCDIYIYIYINICILCGEVVDCICDLHMHAGPTYSESSQISLQSCGGRPVSSIAYYYGGGWGGAVARSVVFTYMHMYIWWHLMEGLDQHFAISF